MYWDSARLPALVARIQAYNQSRLVGWDVRFLRRADLNTYIAPAEYPPAFDKLIVQHKADWIRLALLSKYGGCWLDASIILNHADALDRLYEESVAAKSEFTGFRCPNKCRSMSAMPPLCVDNWFLMAPRRSPFLRLAFEEFDRAVRTGFELYRTQILKEGIDVQCVHQWKTSDYLTMQMCMLAVLQRLPSVPPMIFHSSVESMYKLHTECKWDAKCMEQIFHEEPERVRRIPYIKLTRGERKKRMDLTAFLT